jgi:ribosomal protein S8
MAVLTDPISDFLTRFKNAARAGNAEFTAPYSKIKADIAEILASAHCSKSAQNSLMAVRSSQISSAYPLLVVVITLAHRISHASCPVSAFQSFPLRKA